MILWLVLGGVALMLMLAVGGAAVVFMMGGRDSGKGSRVEEQAKVPGALTDSEIKNLANDLSSRHNEPIEVPTSLDRAIEILEYSDGTISQSPFVARSQKLIASEWLYAREVDESKRARAAKAIAGSYHSSSGGDLQKSLLRTYRPWGNKDNVHLFLKWRTNDSEVPQLLELVEKYPTPATMEKLAPYLKTKYGDVAEKILLEIGNDGDAKLLVPIYDSKDTVAVDRVKKIFGHWNVDVDKTRIEYYTTKAVGGDAKSWEMVASIPFEASMQPTVIDGLRRFRRDTFNLDDWLDACLVWGDDSVLPLIHEILNGKYSFTNTKALAVITKFPHKSSVPVLVNRLLNSWSTEGEPLSSALIKLYEAKIDGVDFEKEVHVPAVKRINELQFYRLPAVKKLLDTTNFDQNLFVDQCITDLQSTETFKPRKAMEALSKMQVIEERRFDVAKSIADAGKLNRSSGYKAAFLHWANHKNPHLYEILNNDKFGGTEWQTALKIALKGTDNDDKLIVPIARALGDFFKGEEVVAILAEHDERAEKIMMTILQSNSGKEIIGACQVLQRVGTEKCIPRLKELLKIAEKAKNRKIYDAVQMAGTAITNRVGEDKIKEYEKELRDKRNQERRDKSGDK